MTRRDHVTLTALACAGLLLALYQCWYIYLPLDEATREGWFDISDRLNDLGTLHKFGHALYAWIVPAFPALAALFFWQAALCLFGWHAAPAHREAWLGVARLLYFPLAGLAVFVLLNDYLVSKATSVSAVAVGLICVAGAVLAVRRGLEGTKLAAGGRWILALGAAGVLFGWFLHGAGTARREHAEVTRRQATQPPLIRWASFARGMPRTGAARVGNPLATTEILLFVDPQHPSYEKLLAEAADLETTDVIVHIYGGPGLVTAQRTGTLDAFLRNPQPGAGDEVWHRLHEKARAQIDTGALPAALWKDGRRNGDFTLAEVVAAARPR